MAGNDKKANSDYLRLEPIWIEKPQIIYLVGKNEYIKPKTFIMRAILFTVFIATLYLTSCNDTGTASGSKDDQAQKNLEAARKIAKAFETGDVSAIDSVVAEDFLDHTDRGDKVGRDSLKAMVNFVHNNFKDMKGETIKDMADGEYVFQLMRYTGTSDGTMGMPAGPYDMRSMEVSRFKDGKAVEHWAFMEMSEMMKMMGMQQPSMPHGDTTKVKSAN